MADLAKELEELHASVVKAVRERIDKASHDEEGNPIDPPNNDDLRVALQLLKQNSITATLSQDDTAKLRSQMASKLDFSALKDKPNVVPMVRPDNAATA